MKYYTCPSGQIENGPGGKPLLLVLDKEKISEEEFTKIIDDFFNDPDMEVDEETREESKALCWQYLKAGKDVTIRDQTLKIRK